MAKKECRWCDEDAAFSIRAIFGMRLGPVNGVCQSHFRRMFEVLIPPGSTNNFQVKRLKK